MPNPRDNLPRSARFELHARSGPTARGGPVQERRIYEEG